MNYKLFYIFQLKIKQKCQQRKSLNFIEQISRRRFKNGLSLDKLRFVSSKTMGIYTLVTPIAICLNFGLGIDLQKLC